MWRLELSKIFTKGGDIDFLVGMSSPELHKQISMEKLPNGLSIMRTRFGSCIVGTAPNISNGNYECGAFPVNNISMLSDPLSGVNIWKRFQCEVAGINRETLIVH